MSIQEILKEYIPEYFASLAEPCRTCEYLLNEKECECCKGYNMYKENEETNINNLNN